MMFSSLNLPEMFKKRTNQKLKNPPNFPVRLGIYPKPGKVKKRFTRCRKKGNQVLLNKKPGKTCL